jgi:hypothetical protein
VRSYGQDADGIVRTVGRIALGAWEYHVAGGASSGSGGGTVTPPPAVETAAVSGSVRDTKGQPIGGVTLTPSGSGLSQTAVTDQGGLYRFPAVTKSMGYTITPAKDGYLFAPASLGIVNLSGDVTDQNLTGRRKLRIAGYIRDASGAAIEAVRLDLLGETARSTMSDSSGHYEFTEVPEGAAYSVKSEKAGYAFEPPTLSTGTLADVIENWNFSATYISRAVANAMKIIGSAVGRGTINPDRGETARIYFKGSSTGRFECRIFSMAGDQVWESVMADVQEGTFEWHPGTAATGIYVVRVTGPGVSMNKKIAILR